MAQYNKLHLQVVINRVIDNTVQYSAHNKLRRKIEIIMSKNLYPTDNNKPPVVVRDSISNGGGVIVDTIPTLSWKFPIVDKEPQISLASVGLRVYGKVMGEDVFVRNGSITLGFAPKDVAIEIIQALTGKRGRLERSVISVTSNPNNSKDSDVWVELFLR